MLHLCLLQCNELQSTESVGTHDKLDKQIMAFTKTNAGMLRENLVKVNDVMSAPQVTLDGLQKFAADHLPPYQIPKLLKLTQSIPRNAMGKINKKELLKNMFPKQ